MNPKSNFLTKSACYIILLLLAVVLFYKFSETQNGFSNRTGNHDNNATSHQNAIPINAHLFFTKHAKCRMDCRHIDES